MDLLCIVSRKLSNHAVNQIKQFENITKGDVLCSISCQNVLAFSTTIALNDNSSCSTWGSHIYVADLNNLWLVHKVCSNRNVITVIEWDLSGENLLIADDNGLIQVWLMKEHLINEWTCRGVANFPGEHILAAVFFHNGKKISLVAEKKDSFHLNERFSPARIAPSVKGFGGRPLEGCLVVSATGMVGVLILARDAVIPGLGANIPSLNSTSESLGAIRNRISTADICYAKNGHFLVAVSSGNVKLPIQCYRVSLKKVEDKYAITSQALPSFFLQNTEHSYRRIVALRFTVKEDTDSLVVAANNTEGASGGTVELWELREKALSVHKLFDSNKPGNDPMKTVVWQHQCSHKVGIPVVAMVTSKLSVTSTVPPPSYVVLGLADGSVCCLFRDGLKQVSTGNINTVGLKTGGSGASPKQPRLSAKLSRMDITWLGNVLVCSDLLGQLYLYRLMPITEQGGPMTVPYACTLLEYCLVTGLDWWDLLVCLRASMLEAVVEKFTESFNRQNSSCKQFYYVQFLCIKTSLYRMSASGQSKAADLTSLLMLYSVANAFKSLLRPSDLTNYEKGPAESLAAVVTESLTDVDKVLIHLEAKDYTMEHSTLQSLQQLIQWVADLAINLLARLPETKSLPGRSASGYQLTKDYQAINTLRELLVIIRIWGLLRQSCLPVFVRSVESLDVLAHLFKLLSRLIQNPEPDENLIDDCCLLPNQVMIPQINQMHRMVHLASPSLFHQTLPIQLTFGVEPQCLEFVPDNGQSEILGQTDQVIDSFRHIYLGINPLVVKQCCRCGDRAQVQSNSRRTAAIQAWDARWSRGCRCGGLWRIQYANNRPNHNSHCPL